MRKIAEILVLLSCGTLLVACGVGNSIDRAVYTTVGKPIDRAVYTTIDLLAGPTSGEDISDSKLCLYGTRVERGFRTWSDNSGYDGKLAARGLSCGVGQSEFWDPGELYSNSRGIYLYNLTDKTLCKVIELSVSGSIGTVQTHISEAERRNLACAKIKQENNQNNSANIELVELPKPNAPNLGNMTDDENISDEKTVISWEKPVMVPNVGSWQSKMRKYIKQ